MEGLLTFAFYSSQQLQKYYGKCWYFSLRLDMRPFFLGCFTLSVTNRVDQELHCQKNVCYNAHLSMNHCQNEPAVNQPATSTHIWHKTPSVYNKICIGLFLTFQNEFLSVFKVPKINKQNKNSQVLILRRNTGAQV